MLTQDPYEWAGKTVGNADLGDIRRTKRLVDVLGRMASHVGQSLSKCCSADAAARLGGYRLLRNEQVDPRAICEAGFAQTARLAQEHEVLLALEDTTKVGYEHEAAQELGQTGTKANAKRRGFAVHSVLLVQAAGERTVGLIEQTPWCRQPSGHDKKHQRQARPYSEKESYKWEHASEQMAARLGPAMTRTISVCDREADLYEYLSYKLGQGQRFVVRAKVDRKVLESQSNLFETLKSQAPAVCSYPVKVEQRAGRPGRTVAVQLHALSVRLAAPQKRPADSPVLELNAIWAQQIEPGEPGQEPLCWVLLTSEPIGSAEQAFKVVRYYELRWRIEEYHKAWKSGVGVERQRFASAQNLERMMAITALLAVRLLQLREAGQPSSADESEQSCQSLLEPMEWKILWMSTEKKRPLPEVPPSARWAYLAIARLGGFADTKRTGRPGWDALWEGWFRLQERLQGYYLSQQAV